MNLKIAALIHVTRALAHFSLLVSAKAKTGNGWGIGGEGKESPERKTYWEKERGGMSDFAAVFSLPSLLFPRGVPLWYRQEVTVSVIVHITI